MKIVHISIFLYINFRALLVRICVVKRVDLVFIRYHQRAFFQDKKKICGAEQLMVWVIKKQLQSFY